MSRGPDREGRRVFPRFSIRDDVDRELETHLAFLREELEAKGWESSAAEAEALRRFGDLERVSRSCQAIAKSQDRAVRRAWMLDAFWQDVRYAVRNLLKNPGFALVALLTLGLGIGANTAAFSVVRGVLLRPLPYERPHELVWIREARPDGGAMDVAWPNYRDWQEQSDGFSGITAVNGWLTTVLGGEEPVRVRAARVSRGFWSVFPVTPIQGRLTDAEDHRPGAAPVAVVSRSFWETRLAGRPLSRISLEIVGVRVQVVGVVPDRLDVPAGAQIWAPAEPFQPSESRTAHNWDVVGRLRSDVALERGTEELETILLRSVEQEPEADPDFLATGVRVVPLMEEVVGNSPRALYLLLGAAGLVLLVACANLAGTLLAQGSNRDRELAVRSSLGASRGRITRQLLTESLLLGGLGGAGGVALAYLVVRGIRGASPAFLPRVSEIALDGQVLAYALATALATTILFGLLPARSLARTQAAEVLRSGSRGNARDGRARAWRLLVGGEVAVSLVLLVGSALLIRSFQTVIGEDPGFDPSDVNVAPVSLSLLRYEEEQDHVEFYRELLRRIQGHSAVESAGVLSATPLYGGVPPNGRMELDGDPAKQTVGHYVVASRGAFSALDIPLLQGRLFEETDGPGNAHVALVSESFARENWPDQDPIGRQVTGGGMDNFYEDRVFARVVGVVGDVRFRELGGTEQPTVYFPYHQRPFRIQYGARLVVETTSVEPSSLIPDLRATIREADPEIPISVRTYRSVVRESLGERRFVTMILGGFSVLALVLAAVGIFGVVSYVVARRTREMGIRLALGADPEDVLRTVLGPVMGMVLGGLVVGFVGALALTRTLESLLYQVTPLDPLSLAVGVLGLAATALMAAWIPARAGTRVDPMITMQGE